MRKLMPSFLQHPLAREIALAIAIKLVVVAAIFYGFFDGRSVHPDAAAIAEHLSSTGPSNKP